MSCLEFSTPIGPVQFHWNPAGLLERIRLLDIQPDKLRCKPGRLQMSLCLDQHTWKGEELPPGMLPLAYRFLEFLKTGKSLQPVPWDLIEQKHLTDFQRRVYESLCLIPPGETRTYAWVAKRIGQFKAARAVGQALRTNPFPILIPCHRVIKSNGLLGGFMGEEILDEPVRTESPTLFELVRPTSAAVGLKGRLLGLEHDFLNPQFEFISELSRH